MLASYSWDMTFRLWDPRARRELVRGPFQPAAEFLFSRDDRLLGPFRDRSTLRVAEVADGRECRLFPGVPGHVDITPNERLLVSPDETGVHFWDVTAGARVATLPLPGAGASYFLPKGKGLLVATPQAVYRYPLDAVPGPGGSTLRVGRPTIVWRGPLHNPRLAVDGRTLMGVRTDRQAILIDLDDPGRQVRLDGHPNVQMAALSPDRRWAATGTWKGSGIKVWHARDGKFHRDLPIKGGAYPFFSPDGRWLATGADRDYTLWEVDTWGPRHVIPKVDENELPGVVAFSADGALMAVRHSLHRIKLIDPGAGRELATLEPPFSSPIEAMYLSPGGTRLVAVSRTGFAAVWDLRLVRRQLADRGLDWGLPPYPPEKATGAAPLRVEVPAESEEPPEALRAAIARIGKALETRPGDPQSYFTRAQYHQQLGEHAAAAADWRKVLEILPEQPTACNSLAWIYATGPGGLRDPNKALPLAQRAVRLAPDEAACRNTLGVVYYRLGQYDAAVETLERSVRDSKGPPMAHDLYFLAMSYHRLGKAARARGLYEQALRWQKQATLPAADARELEAFRAEAEALLGQR
ncbi:MAG: tetratricopeptide repeat protein [Gemmataceae bacterium]